MRKLAANIVWFLLALAGAWAYATLALRRGEPLNSAYILVAALCSYAIGYRFYSKWIAARVLALEPIDVLGTVLGIMAAPIMIKTGYDAKLSAGAAMAFSSVSVVTNSLLMRRYKPRV